MRLWIEDGDRWPHATYSCNEAKFSVTDTNFRKNPLVCFPIFKAVTLILSETWEATYAKVQPDNFFKKVPD